MNRLQGARDKTFSEIELIELPQLILELWEAPRSKLANYLAQRPFHTTRPAPTLSDIQKVLNTNILTETCTFTKFFGKKLDGVKLTSLNNQWIQLTIDEQVYFKHHIKDDNLIELLLRKHFKPVAPPPPSPIIVSKQPVQPIPQTEPNSESQDSSAPSPGLELSISELKPPPEPDSTPSVTDCSDPKITPEPARFFLFIALALSLSVVLSVSFGVSWLLSLGAISIASLTVFWIIPHFQSKAQTPTINKQTDPLTPPVPPQEATHEKAEKISPSAPLNILPIPKDKASSLSQNSPLSLSSKKMAK